MLKEDLKIKIEDSIEKFLQWLKEFGYQSYDQFDFWGSSLGIYSKKLFFRKKVLAAPLVLSLQIMESFFPQFRVLFAKKERFAIGDAHFVLAYLNWYRYTNDCLYLEIARRISEEIFSYAISTPSGKGWGYPYTWVTRRAIYPPGTPFITVTPYCFDAFLAMSDFNNEEKYFNIAEQILKFAARDLNETVISKKETAISYSPIDQSQVINANAYRAAMLLKGYKILGYQGYLEKAIKNVNFVINQQQDNGSWYYAVNEKFIDHFHTCFVLKNLYKTYLMLKDERILKSLKRGYDYYRNCLFRKDQTPLHFSRSIHPKFRKIEMYDYAESIALGPLLNSEVNGALDFSLKLALQLIDHFQSKKGYFITRVTPLNTRNKVPYLRWPQAQIFYALTSLLLALREKSD